MFPALLIQILLVLLIAGVVLWGIQQFPLDATIARLIKVVIVVVIAIWLIYILIGLLPSGPLYLPHR